MTKRSHSRFVFEKKNLPTVALWAKGTKKKGEDLWSFFSKMSGKAVILFCSIGQKKIQKN